MTEHEFTHAVRASAPIGHIGEPTRTHLAAINERIALVPQEADNLFVWNFEISNNSVDSHGTWMDRTSLENYARQASTGRGIPYLRHHNTEADERGRVFAGTLKSGEWHESDVGAVPLARDLFRRRERETHLIETAFMVRGLTFGGTSNDDLIANIEAGVSASNSIGFSVYTPASPGSRLECDICGVDIFARTEDGSFACEHLPGMEYDVRAADKPTRVVATARVVNATQREASGVYLGSTPGTYTLANRAHALHEAGKVSEDEARRLEDMLELERGMVTLGRPATVYSFPKASPSGAISNPTADTTTETAENGSTGEHDGGDMTTEYNAVARVREVLGDDPDRLAAIELSDVSLEADPVGALHASMADALGRVERELAEAVESDTRFRSAMRERLHLDDGEDIAAGLDRLTADAEVAREYRGELVAELLRQMTRAGLTYDEGEQTALANGLTPAQLRKQTDMYREAANRKLTPGRVTEPEVEHRKPKAGRKPVGYAG